MIDSIVRQSRHQFGSEKDVFGPRFTKNIVTTFQSLLKCPPEEKVISFIKTFWPCRNMMARNIDYHILTVVNVHVLLSTKMATARRQIFDLTCIYMIRGDIHNSCDLQCFLIQIV